MAGACRLPSEGAGSERRRCVRRDGRGHGGKAGDGRSYGREMALARFLRARYSEKENPVQSN